jgi:hypothetical protein
MASSHMTASTPSLYMPTKLLILSTQFCLTCNGKAASQHFYSLKGLVEKVTNRITSTDITFLKTPPADGYLEPATDLLTGFYNVIANIKNGVYLNEYQFMANLWKLINSAKDGHFRFLPDILSKALKFNRNVAIVSISMDGGSPKIYTYSEWLS